MVVEGAGDPLAELRADLARRGEPRLADLADRLQADQARRWRGGRGVPAEAYRDLLPAAGDRDDLLVQLILGEILLRRERGERPDRAEYARRFPDLAGILAAHLELDRHLEAAGETEGGSGARAPGPITAVAADATSDFTPPGGAGDGHPPPPVEGLARGAAVRYFGDYEIRRELGRGGMGVVYEARQVSLNRPVALKMIRAGVLADDAELRRFRNEAEAIALLDHPGMVPIYEVAELDGQHYFSMKLIPGGSLAPLLDRYGADPRAAALLAAEAAEAVAHAHARGVLHRDLKPANILIDDEGRPCVTDLGLAKRVAADVESTASGAIAGTPAYMAPEQATGRRGAITTATDVYGLGAVLYAMLTGRAPFGGDSVIETLDAVRSRPPEPPTRFNARVPRDLETICLKCLEKDPKRRYATAQALADDLRAWLGSRPISARRVGAAERAWLWCKRRPAVAALTAAVLLAAVLGTAAVIVVQTRANRLLEKKNLELLASNAGLDEQRIRAEDREAQAIDAVNQFGDVVARDPALKDNPALESLRKELLKQPLRFFTALRDRLQADRDTRPESLRRLGMSAFNLARLTVEIGDRQNALIAYRESVAIFQVLADAHPADEGFRKMLGSGHDSIGTLLMQTGKPAEALMATERALAIRQELADDDPDVAEFQEDLARSHLNRGNLLTEAIKRPEALQAYERALAIRQKLADQHPKVTDFRRGLATTYYSMGRMWGFDGRLDEAKKALERALAIRQELADAHPDVAEFRRDLAHAHAGIGAVLGRGGKRDDALAAVERSVAIYRKLADAHPAVIDYRNGLASAYNVAGAMLAETGRPADAMKAYESALAIKQKLAQDHPGVAEFAFNAGQIVHNLAELDLGARRPAEAYARFRQATEWFRKAHDLDPTNRKYLQSLSSHMRGQIAMGRDLGDRAGEPEARRELARLRALDPDFAVVSAYVKGERTPSDNAERIEMAQAARFYGSIATTAKFYGDALRADPRLADDRRAGHRYNAACAAALAGCGRGEDDPPPGASAKAEFRRQAREWLEAERAAWAKVLESGAPQAGPTVAKTLAHWQQDRDLSGIRDAKYLARLPEAERKGWESLWADVAALRKRAEAAPPPAGRAPAP